ncbi:DMT(drug/metabolite transporter) superfamily permease [Desulfosporosinus orientis DSM 765]|uniref:DMT(Drug/metabolite transporter) superfamily permease n=1 Tax=Desulfosporosinus orientis (strain ATCC 19365 / DSM 765 / NCIMB 8382 / VKM B-1628 / Singapore I) TaxID=768706 RepID=G7W5B7_DESOD|nr:DMT family transporter [Desulfosporosinus orientis]AET66345.1 DMT(drug/metabolite transporter) superfamily permease [Desulfosporosinus orientis DSM 765]
MRNEQKRGLQGVGAILGAGTGYALMSILVKEAFRLGLDPFQVIALQSWIASIILLIYAACFAREIFKVSLQTLWLLTFQGLVGVLGTSLLYAYSLKFLSVSVAILLLYLYPALVLAAGVIIWHKRVNRQEMAAFLLTFAGTTLASGILSGVNAVALIGIVLGLTAAMAYASFNIAGEFVLAKVSPLAAMCFTQWVCGIALLVIMNNKILNIPWQNIQTWKIGFLLATVASIIPFYLILFGIKRLGANQASILSTFELPMTFILAAIFLNEFPSGDQLAGGGLVLVGILLLNWRSKSEQRNEEEALYQERSD